MSLAGHPTSGRAARADAAPLPWIDALRGLAILMVLANHVALAMPGLSALPEMLARFGQMGVQLFFVVSAYTLCRSWHERRDEPQRTLRFLLRRLFRIAPLYWFALALFAGLHLLFAAADEPGPYSTGAIAANLLFVHGFVASANNHLVPGGWSIGTEMAFYALFPLLMAALARRPGVGAALLAFVLALGMALLAQAARGVPLANNSFDYFHLINQLPVFLLGVVLFAWSRHEAAPRHGRRGLAAPLLVGALALGATAALWRSGLAWAFAVVPASAGVGFAALALALQRWDRPLPLLQALGRASYAIYIVHTLFAWHGVRALAPLLPGPADLRFLLALALATGASLIAAHGLQRLIEQPGIALGRRVLCALPHPQPALAR